MVGVMSTSVRIANGLADGKLGVFGQTRKVMGGLTALDEVVTSSLLTERTQVEIGMCGCSGYLT